MDRRTAIKYGLTGLAVAGGFSGTTSAYHEHRDDFGTVVDVVEAGADPNGSESISPVIEEYCEDDTLLEFPDGRYYMDEQVRFTDFENFGLVGTGDATLVPANYWNFVNGMNKLFRLGTYYAPGRDLLIENFEVDLTAPDTGVRAFEACVSDGLVARDVDIRGEHDSGSWGPGLFRVTDPGGEGLVEGFRAPDGSAPQWETPANFAHGGPTGILCNYNHRGTIRFRDCVLDGFPDNGLYVQAESGDVIVEGGVYRNCGATSIRIGADDVSIEGARVVVDRDPFDSPQEGIRLDYGDWFDLNDVTVDIQRPNGEAINFQDQVGGAFLRNSSLYVGDNAHVGVRVDDGTGPTYFKNVDLRMDGSNNAIRIEGTNAGEVGLADVRITGDAGGRIMRHAIYCGRNDCDFRRVTIDQPGGNQRRGIWIDGDDAFLHDCRFTCTEWGLSIHGDDAWINSCYSEPYDDTAPSVLVSDSSSGNRFKNNDFPAGIRWR